MPSIYCTPLQERGELLELQEVRGEVRGERGSILPLSEFKSYPKMEKKCDNMRTNCTILENTLISNSQRQFAVIAEKCAI